MRQSGLAWRPLALCLLLAFHLALAGCWDIRYLDKLGVVLAVGVDIDESHKHKYIISVQVVLPNNVTSGEAGGDGSPVMTIAEAGDTLFEAFRRMSAKTSRRLFFSHAQMLVVSEKAARDSLYPLVDLIERNADIRSDISVVVAKGMRAEQLLQIQTQMESVPASQMKDMLETNQEAQGQTYNVTIHDIAAVADSTGVQAALPSIGTEGDLSAGNSADNVKLIKPDVLLEMKTMAVFREGRLLGFLTPLQSRGLTWGKDKIKGTVMKFGCPQSDGYYMIEVTESRTKTTAVTGKNGLPHIRLELRLHGAVHEIACPDLIVEDETELRELEHAFSEAVTSELESTIGVLQKKLRSDVLGWGRAVRRHQYAQWESIAAEWDDIFPKVSYEIHCISHIGSMGVRSNSIVK